MGGGKLSLKIPQYEIQISCQAFSPNEICEFLFTGAILPRRESLEERKNIQLLWVSAAGISDKEFKPDHFVSLEFVPSAEPLVDQLGSTFDERQKTSCKGQARKIDDFFGNRKKLATVSTEARNEKRFKAKESNGDVDKNDLGVVLIHPLKLSDEQRFII